jgi:hypothetical protein
MLALPNMEMLKKFLCCGADIPIEARRPNRQYAAKKLYLNSPVIDKSDEGY